MEEVSIQAKPMGVVIHDTFRMYAEVFFSVLPLCIGFALPLQLSALLLDYLMNTMQQPILLIVITVFFAFLLLAVISFFYGFLLCRIFSLLTKDQKTLGDAAWMAARKWFKLFTVALITTSLIMLGSMLLLFPGIFLLILLTFSMPAIVLENETVIGAIKMSAYVVWGNWWRTCFVLLFPMGLIGFFLAIVELFLQPHVGDIGLFFFQVFTAGLVFPFTVTLVIMQLSDLQVRRTIKDAEEAERARLEDNSAT